MVDFRPVAYVIGRILIVLAILMLAPAIIDWRAGTQNGLAFAQSAALTGVVGGALTLALRHPSLHVVACDQSAVAVASARATAIANGVGDRVEVVRDDMLGRQADGSAAFIALNPPFHSGAAVHEGIAPRMFAEAARVLRPGGELWAVWNSGLRYRPALERLVGPTRQIARNAKFTVTASTRR